ncbi:MAG: hypothetical protein J5525_12880 [Lachnospiraceae bacterium]|nr:hypothetical protein [Lachnospiraceae bacterium]
MTKEEYLKDITPHEEWIKSHEKYVADAIDELKDYFDVDKFITDHIERALSTILRNILADAYRNYNCDLGEFDNYVARLLSIPFEEVAEYRTERFWEEIA